ncbi:MAG TPA: protein-L-isoaspartate(D-aspartate) O-methyltransferase [Candidatus Cloacimonadota bacterium]|nr:protein-L-isoaspartate(D-aspartate) O-methyltransferase [Candidatus Cloacimonadota bacterium]
MRYEDQRALLVRELELQGIKDERVLRAFLNTPRELYVPEEHQSLAYHNRALPIAERQTISQPLMVAIMLQTLELTPEDTVLEIGTGSGYETAVLASIVKEVCSVERLENLSLQAQQILKKQGFRNVYFRIGDGALGWEKAFPAYNSFDKIIVSAGARQIPSRLTEQLAEGGRMVIPVGEQQQQKLVLLTKKDGVLSQSDCGLCAFVPLVTST